MRSFATIATFATLALSAVTSALPTGLPIDGLLGSTGLISVKTLVDGINTCVSNVGNPQVNLINVGGTQKNSRAAPPVPGVPDLTALGGQQNEDRGEPKGVPDVLVAVTAQIVPKVKDLAAKISVAGVDVHVALDLALSVFAEIKGLLDVAVGEIQVIVKGDVQVALSLEGKVLDIKIFAKIVANLLNAIILTIGLVVKVCASIDIKAFIAICIEIAGVLAVLVSLVVKIAADIVVEIGPLVKLALDICVHLNLKVLVDVLTV